MSIRGYIIKRKTIVLDGEEYHYDRPIYAFNLWKQPEIKDWLLDAGGEDYSNDDSVGKIEIHRNNFMNLYRRKCNNTTSLENQISLKEIERHTRGQEWITIECF